MKLGKKNLFTFAFDVERLAVDDVSAGFGLVRGPPLSHLDQNGEGLVVVRVVLARRVLRYKVHVTWGKYED